MTPTRPDVEGLPETIPARMVNEFVYCPRLFHLEWVQGRFATSDDVEEGLYVHRVVDEPGGDLPDADDDLERFAGRTSRSLWLTSADLGVTAKLDIVEVEKDGTVVPVDYKKGSPDRNGKPWPADEIQSVLQGMLLRDAGYQVEQVEIWYAEPRRRVVIPLDDARVTRTRKLLAQAWEVAATKIAPPPLVGSPKCPGCSLVGLCLPDEVHALAVREREPVRPRRVMAADPDNRPVYVMEQGAYVGVRRGRLEVFKEREQLGSYRLIDVSQLCLHGNVTVTPQVMRELFAREIPSAGSATAAGSPAWPKGSPASTSTCAAASTPPRPKPFWPSLAAWSKERSGTAELCCAATPRPTPVRSSISSVPSPRPPPPPKVSPPFSGSRAPPLASTSPGSPPCSLPPQA